jgi:hypothetical protein
MTSELAARPLAGTEQLGDLVCFHRSRISAIARPFLAILALAVAFLIGGAFAVANTRPQERLVVLVLVGLMELLCVVALIRKGLPRRRPDVLLFTDGFAEVLDDQVTATCRWDEAVSFQEFAIRREAHGIHVETSYNFWVGRRDGHTFAFGDWLEEVQALGGALRERLVPQLVARGRAAWQAGEVLDFGPLRLDREGLSQGTDRLPLRELEELEVQKGWLRVRRAGQAKDWYQCLVGDVPNLPVLLDLVDRARAGPAAGLPLPRG